MILIGLCAWLSLSAAEILPDLPQPDESRRRLVVGGDFKHPPYEFLDSQGQPAGFNIELLTAIGQVMDWQVTFRLGPWAQALENLAAGRIDILPLYDSAEYQAAADFSQPYLFVHYEAFARSNRPAIGALEALRGREVLVRREGLMHAYLRRQDLGILLVPVESEPDALRLLASGRHDYALVSHIVGLLAVRRHQLGNLAAAGPPLLPRGYALAVAKGRRELLEQLDQGLTIVKETGRYNAIYNRWLGDTMSDGKAFQAMLWYGGWALALLSALTIAALFWSWLLKRQVNQRTRALERELTERRQAEAALRASEARFRDLTEATSDWIWEMDEQLRFTYLSDRFFDLTGILPERIIGRTRWDLGNGPQWQQHREALQRRQPFRDFIYRVNFTGRPGDERYLKISGRPVYNDRGEFQGYRGTGTDATEQKRAEQEVKRMRRYLENIIDSMPSVLIGVDPEGRITEWNRRAQEVSGVRWETARGRFFADVFPQLAGQLEPVRQAIRQGRPIKTPRMTTTVQGETQYADIMVYPLLTEGGASGAVIRMDDVTARVRIEAMMVQTEKMLSIGGLAAGMAHEINNPLGAILQGCQNILRRLSPALPKNRQTAAALDIELEQVRGYLEQRGILHFLEGIREAGSRAAKIVMDMLAFSRRSEARFTYTELTDILETALRLAASDYDLKKRYDFKKIAIERDYDPGLGPVYCDKTEIEQVVLNLVKNAAQAMVGQAAPRITLRTRREPHHARIEVADNGPGMEEKIRRRVFEPFFTTKEIGVGTGLGLSVSYFIITEQHKGTLSVASTPGQGSCFTLRLPLTPDPHHDSRRADR